MRNAVPTRKNTTKSLSDTERFAADLKSNEALRISRAGQDIFTLRGTDRTAGCLVIVRPDQYVAQVLLLDGYEELAAFFDGFMMPL